MTTTTEPPETEPSSDLQLAARAPWKGEQRKQFLDCLRRGDLDGLVAVVVGDTPSEAFTPAARSVVRTLAEVTLEMRRQNVATIGDSDVFIRRSDHGDLRQVVGPVLLSLDDNTLYRIPDRWQKFLVGTNTLWTRGAGYYESRPVYDNPHQAKLTFEGYNRINAVAGCSVAQPPTIMVDAKSRENPYVERDGRGDIIRIVIGVNVAGPAPMTGNIVVVQYTLDLDPRMDLQRMLAAILKGDRHDGAPTDDAPDVRLPVRLLHQDDWPEWRKTLGEEAWNWHWTPMYGGLGYAHDITHAQVQKAYDKFIGILEHVFRKAQTVARRNAMKMHPALSVQTVTISDDGHARIRGVGWATGAGDIDRYRRALNSVAAGNHAPDIEVIENVESYSPEDHTTGDSELDPVVEPDEAASGEVAERNRLLEQLDEWAVEASTVAVRDLPYPPPDDATPEQLRALLTRAETFIAVNDSVAKRVKQLLGHDADASGGEE